VSWHFVLLIPLSGISDVRGSRGALTLGVYLSLNDGDGLYSW
jgi:hypothetical protein